MTYSKDLRERVIEFVCSGGSKTKAAKQFGVSRWCIYDWLSRESLAPKKQGCPRPWKLDPEQLEAHVRQYPDAYQHERAMFFGVSRHSIGYGLKRLGIKKKTVVPREKRQMSQ